MSAGELRAGAARLSLDPPLDLPLIGFVRQAGDATGYGRFGLETSAIRTTSRERADCHAASITATVRTPSSAGARSTGSRPRHVSIRNCAGPSHA